MENESSRLEHLEAVIEKGLNGFLEVGEALIEIRESRLYRGTHGTFEAYCDARWGFTDRRARQLMAAAEIGTIVPVSKEGQARELLPLLEAHGEDSVREIWDGIMAIKEDHPDTKITARLIKDSVKFVLDGGRSFVENPRATHVVSEWLKARERHGSRVDAVNVGALLENRLKRIAREEAAAQKVIEAEVITLPTSVRIEHVGVGDLEVEENSVSLIFTDPPYPEEFLGAWHELAVFAQHALKPGGLLVAYSGQYHLPSVMHNLARHLEYVWSGALVTPGQHNQVLRRHIRSAAKPILFYAKPPYVAGPWFEDAYISEQRVKDDHEWQQSIGAAEYYIKTLTAPGDLVCDPFLGSGTTAHAAHKLGRSFVGCDVDPRAINLTKARFAA